MARMKLLGRQAWMGTILIGLAVALTGCAHEQPYVSEYSFYPQPVTVNVMRHGQSEETPLTTQVSVLGVRRANPERNISGAVVVRLIFENRGSVPVAFDPGSLQLVTGTLQPFPPPQVQPPVSMTITPGQQPEVTAAFPLPPGGAERVSLSNLRLRWQVTIEGYPIPQSALFEQGNGQPTHYTAPDAAY